MFYHQNMLWNCILKGFFFLFYTKNSVTKRRWCKAIYGLVIVLWAFSKTSKQSRRESDLCFVFVFQSSRLLWIIWIGTCCQCSLIKSNWTVAPFTSHQHSVHVYVYVLCSYLEVLSHNWLPLGVGQSGIVRCFRKCHLQSVHHGCESDSVDVVTWPASNRIKRPPNWIPIIETFHAD